MRWRKQVASAVMSVMLVTVICGCSKTAAVASVDGYRGEIKLEAVQKDDGSIEILIIRQDETIGIGDIAVEETVRRINEQQTVSVDAVSGATISSLATVACADAALCKLSNINIEALRALPTPQAMEYKQKSCDVVVVGAGGAGLTAAIAAAQQGASVIVVEKLGVAGGSTARSEGKVMATGSELQQQYREPDSYASFAAYLFSYADSTRGSFRHLELAEHSASNLTFLQTNNVAFSEVLDTTYPGVSPKRVHQVTAGGETGGGALIKPLVEQAEQLGVQIYYNTKANEILKGIDGSVTGVYCKNTNGDILTVTAPAVVIATGGFDRNASLLADYGLSVGVTVSGVGSDGDGIVLARDAGAALYTQASLIAVLDDMETGLFSTSGLIVDPDGNRIANEAGNPYAIASALIARGYCEAYLIADATAYNEAIRRGLSADTVITADSIASLQAKLGMSALETTVADYNGCCQAKQDDVFQKNSKYLNALHNEPFCAVKLTLRSYGTLGGIVTDANCQVLDRDNLKINGLFGAGEAVNGAFYTTGYPGPGASLAEVIETGRIAGEQAAAYTKKH